MTGSPMIAGFRPRHSGRSPLGPEGRAALISDCLARARGEEGLGRFVLASSAYGEAIRLDPRDPRPVLGRSRSLRAAGLVVEARRVLDQGLRRCPGSPEILLEVGEAELCEGRPERAAPLFRRVLELRPDCRNARLRLAVSLYMSGERERAFRELTD